MIKNQSNIIFFPLEREREREREEREIMRVRKGGRERE